MNKIRMFIALAFIIALSGCSLTTASTATTTTSTTQTTQTTSTTATTAEPLDYKLVWSDEFNYTGLPDPTKWTYDLGGGGWGNNELEYYTNRQDNAYVSNGVLAITLKKEDYMGSNYTSARLVSNFSTGRASWKYGKIDVRAKLPQGLGTWPAIWMLPANSPYGGWPNSGEIDIMEHVGYDPGVIHGSLHTGNRHSGNSITSTYTVSDVFNTFHDYSIEWSPNQIKFFVDDVNYFTVDNNVFLNPNSSYMNWPFDQPFHLLLNVAFGGNWGGAEGIDPNFTEAQMLIDYVRVYQLDYQSDTTPPSNVSGINVTASSPVHTVINFNDATDNAAVDHYELYLNNILKTTSTVTRFTLNNLDPDTTYNGVILSVDENGNRSTGQNFTFTTSDYPDVTTKIQAENYYAMSGIQVENCTDAGFGQDVGYIDKGDYLEYKLSVAQSGTYQIVYRVASLSATGDIQLYGGSDGTTFLTETTFQPTGGYQNWTSVTSSNFTLTAGENTIILKLQASGFNINYFQFVKVN